MRLKILSLDIRGLGSPTKVTSLCHELELLNHDIILLQETHVSSKNRPMILNIFSVVSVIGPLGLANRQVLLSFSLRIFLALFNAFFFWTPMLAF